MLTVSKRNRKPHWQYRIFAPLFAIVVIVTLLTGLLIAVSIIQNQRIAADTIAWQYRAQVAANPEDMEQYLRNCEHGMQKWGITHGYDAIFFKRPDNDMSLIMQSLNSSIIRAGELQRLNRTSVEYSSQLDDLRGIIRELNIHAGSWWILHGLVLYIMRLPLIIATIILWILWASRFEIKDPQEIAEEEADKIEKEKLETERRAETHRRIFGEDAKK
ncbi:MAG: hypothetical protein MUD10_01445 [Candidatus Pacebacteria bacterium]|nr:hypothetical protein [Candidatus Paceibacterota bacterium]